MGYPFEKKGWKVYDLDTGNIFVNVYIYPFAPNSEAKSQVVQDNLAVWDNFSDWTDSIQAIRYLQRLGLKHKTMSQLGLKRVNP